MRKLLITVLAFSLSLPFAFGQKDPEARKVLDAMSKKYKAYSGFAADFSYVLENPLEGLNEEFEGKITVKGEKYRLEMAGQEIINNGVTLWTYLEEVNEVNVTNYEPEDNEVTLPRVYTMYQDGFKYNLLEPTKADGKTFDVVDLVPEDLNQNFFKIRLEIARDDKSLRSFKIFDKNGNRYSYRIYNFQVKNGLTDKHFEFDSAKYKNVEIIDFR